MRILCLGDIVGPAAVRVICRSLWQLRKKFGVDFVVANGENCADGNGIDRESAEQLFRGGVDVVTTGNHIWKKKSIRSFLDECSDILRPLNYSALENGFGYTIKEVSDKRILVMNATGNVFMSESDPVFPTIEKALNACEGLYDISVLDIHAEATSEKYALARYFDGRIDIIFGTHTHVQTADERILPKKTGYITDLGMCGPDDSVLGVKSEIIISRFLGRESEKFVFDDKNIVLNGALFDTNPNGFGIVFIKRIKITEDDI